MNMNKNKTNRYMPFIMAMCVVLGIIIGTFFSNHFAGNRLNVINSGSNRLNNLLHLIDDQYVDAVNIDSLVDKAIPQILAELDPHSVYISAKDAAAATDDLKGSFSGVGIEFVIRQDTIHVQNVIQNGPAEKAGLLAGDKIVAVDGKPFVGKIVTNQEAMHRLKGPKDTKVKIGVTRYARRCRPSPSPVARYLPRVSPLPICSMTTPDISASRTSARTPIQRCSSLWQNSHSRDSRISVSTCAITRVVISQPL